MPCGTKQPTKRAFGVAAVCASAVEAGIMASKRGSASAAPPPRRMVRRERGFLLLNIAALFLLVRSLTGCPLLVTRCCLRIHLERGALHNAGHKGREPI